MKRPYRAGDVFDVPLPDGSVASGYVVDAAHRIPVCAFFTGRIEAGIAPNFVSRIADRALVLHRWRVREHGVQLETAGWGAPDSSRIATPQLVQERLVAERSETVWRRNHLVVRDMRTPLSASDLDALPDDARLQWREPPSSAQLDAVSSWVAARSAASVRLYGAASGHLESLRAFPTLRHLLLDARRARLPTLPPLSHLQTCELEGFSEDVERVNAHEGLEFLTVRGRREDVVDAAALHGFHALRALDLSGVLLRNAEAIAQLPKLRALRLTNVAGLRDLSWLEKARVTRLYLVGAVHVDDLGPIERMPHLQQLELRGAWQLTLDDVAWLREAPALLGLTIDIGGRRKNTEIFRARPRAYAEAFTGT